MVVQFIQKRDGKTARFKPNKIKNAISKAVGSVGFDEEMTEDIFSGVIDRLGELNGRHPRIEEIESVILDVSRERGYGSVANSYESYKDRRAHARSVLSVKGEEDRSTTDASLMIQSGSKEIITSYDRERIVTQLEEEANLDHDLAITIAKKAENMLVDVVDRGVREIDTTHLRAFVDLALKSEGLEVEMSRQAVIGIPSRDLEGLIFSKNLENSNVAANNPEAVNLGIAETILKQWGLQQNVFSKEVTEAHMRGDIHIHDLGYPTRVYCSAHSLEYIKKYGLNKALANLESKSNSPNSAAVLNQHVQTFLAAKQADYAGALGFGFLNIFYAPLLNRPVNVVRGKLDGKDISLEKTDLEKLVAQGTFSLNEGDPNYFMVVSERKEMRELPQKGPESYDQVAQNLIFAASQNAFSRGGQTLFIDFNIHTGVPKYMKNVPAIGPGGKYSVEMPDGHVEMVDKVPRFNNLENPDDSKNGDAFDEGLEGVLSGGRIVTYGSLEPAAQRFAKSLLEVWRAGDKDGRLFRFPKCDLHVDENSFEEPSQSEVLDLAMDVTSENGSVYFMFDRGDDAVLAQCCRLKEKIEDNTMLKYPETLRFVGFQNVTVNLARAAYKGKDLEGTLTQIDSALDVAVRAHLDKKEFIQKLLDTDGSPLRGSGKPSDDGKPYIDLEKATYIFGTIGLNEAVQSLTGRQLHEGEDAFRTGLHLVAHMYKRINEIKKDLGLKCTIEETPAESTTRRLAKLDWNDKEVGEQARKVIQGTEENPYYSNSIHFAPDADVGLADRIVGQSRFHDMIASGAIVHAYMGEQRPDEKTLKKIVENTLRKTRCSQLVFSPTYTECDVCGTLMDGEKELCETRDCSNSSKDTLDPSTLSPITRVVGYNSRIKHWNSSQQQIYEDRKRAEKLYAGGQGRDMGWMYEPNGHLKTKVIQFAKEGCKPCESVKENIRRTLEKKGLGEAVDFVVHYLNTGEEEGLVEAAMYDIPLDVVPSVVITGADGHWKKTTRYTPEGSEERSDLITMGKDVIPALERAVKSYSTD